MSADSYAVCPRCASRDPFLDKLDERKWTLREYHEFLLDAEGYFSARYSCRCDECDWSWRFEEHDQPFRADAHAKGEGQ